MEMSKLEKVIQELDDSLKNQHCGFVDGIGDVYAVSEETIKNIIALLKEQDGIIKALESDLDDCKAVIAEQANANQRKKQCVGCALN